MNSSHAKIRVKSVVLIGLITLQLSASAVSSNPISRLGVIPKPVSYIPAKGTFTLTEECAIFVEDGSAEVVQIGRFLADYLNPATGFNLMVKASGETPKAGNIVLSLTTADPKLGDEGYKLTIKSDGIKLIAAKPAGLFNGIQTIRQLLPAKIEQSFLQSGPWSIPAGTIHDFPQYAYRGVMLDVARHFFQVEDVKRYIDLIAAYKMNVMHLHLSDDQGWRIEIKKWPKLTEIGGSTQVGGDKGGFYTQEQYADLVKYAAERYITVIPEIDMPGHTNAVQLS